tara:strand:+ start:187 stop:426 length:240 start_codon:yes stop_codon:yes gene_type:complete
MKDQYLVTFDFLNDNEKSITVRKKTRKTDQVYFIPKSIIIEMEDYIQDIGLWKDCSYEKEKIKILLPKWFCKKALGFYS